MRGVGRSAQLVLLLLAALVGCTTDTTAVGTAALSGPADPEVLDVRGGTRLLVGPPSETVPQTDERPSYHVVAEGDALRLPDEPVLTAALVEHGAVWVTPALELVDSQGALLDRDVVPELAVSADGLVAYPHRTGDDAGVFVVSRGADGWTAPRCVTHGLASADRPLFLDDGRLVVVGAVASGIAGVWIVDPSGSLQPVAVTNAALRTGRPLGPSFVPPPAYHASMHVEDGALVYDDGYGEQRVALPGAR